MGKKTIKYPYLPKGKKINYVDKNNEFIKAAQQYAVLNSLDGNVPTGSVVVSEGKVIGYGSNGSDYHSKHGCERVKQGIPTGEGYELCEGCHPKNHSEPRAIKDAKDKHPNEDLSRAGLYLWGHWWVCQPCWEAIQKAGIEDVYLATDSHKAFDKHRLSAGKKFVDN